MRKINLTDDIQTRLDQVINIMGISSQAIANYLIDKSLRVFEDNLKKISMDLEKNPAVKEAFAIAINSNYKIKNRGSHEKIKRKT